MVERELFDRVIIWVSTTFIKLFAGRDADVSLWKSVLVFLACLASNIGGGISLKFLGYAMPEYSIFITLSSALGSVPLMFIPLWYDKFKTRRDFFPQISNSDPNLLARLHRDGHLAIHPSGTSNFMHRGDERIDGFYHTLPGSARPVRRSNRLDTISESSESLCPDHLVSESYSTDEYETVSDVNSFAASESPEPSWGFIFRRLGIIGACWGTSTFCILQANPWTPGFVQAILSPVIVPFTVAIAMMYGERFSKMQWLGVLIICLGGLWGPLSVKDAGADEVDRGVAATGYHVEDIFSGNDTVLWCVVSALSYLPLAFSIVYMERMFSETAVDMNSMNAWATVSQFFVSFALCGAVISLDSTLSWSFEIGRATKCLFNLLEDEPVCASAFWWWLAS